MPSGRTTNFPWKWAWPRSRDSTIFGIRLNILEIETSNLVGGFVLEMPSGRTNNFPESGRVLGHVTPTIFGIPSNISLKLLMLETSNLIHGFVWAMPSRRTNKFPWQLAWPRSCDPYNFGSTVGYSSDSGASCRVYLRWIYIIFASYKWILLQIDWDGGF